MLPLSSARLTESGSTYSAAYVVRFTPSVRVQVHKLLLLQNAAAAAAALEQQMAPSSAAAIMLPSVPVSADDDQLEVISAASQPALHVQQHWHGLDGAWQGVAASIRCRMKASAISSVPSKNLLSLNLQQKSCQDAQPVEPLFVVRPTQPGGGNRQALQELRVSPAPALMMYRL